MKKELWVSYLLSLGCLFGVAGLHRFYLGKPVTGLLYLVTWGLLGIGTLIDLIKMPDLVAAENLRLLTIGADPQLGLHGDANASTQLAQLMGRQRSMPQLLASTAPAEDPSVVAEQKILRLARDRGGNVTIAMVALETGLPMVQAKSELDRLVQSGFCRVDVTEEGAEVYLFPGLKTTRPMTPS